MRIIFLGSGSAFVSMQENFQSNILFEKDIIIDNKKVTKRLLFDAGNHISEALTLNNIDIFDIDAIYISHLHGDHVHGLEYIGFKTYFTPPTSGKEKLTLIANNQIIDRLWENVLSGTMQHINDATLTLKDYFNVIKLKPKDAFTFAATNMIPVKVPHVISDKYEVPAFGLRFEEDNLKILITSDTQFDYWRFVGFYETYDIIFQECEFLNYPNSVHTQYHELQQLPKKFRKKMYLYHYSLNGKTFEELEAEVLEDGFGGLIKRGQIFDTEKEAKKIIKNRNKN